MFARLVILLSVLAFPALVQADTHSEAPAEKEVAASPASEPYYPPVYTDLSAWYIGFRFGRSALPDSCGVDAISCDDSDTGYGFFGGWQPNDWFGLEFSYNDLGEASASYAVPVNFSLVGEVTAVDISARFRWAFADRWRLYAKTGAAYSSSKVNNSTGSDTAREFRGLLAGGLSFDFNENWQTRFEYQFINNVGDSVTGYTDSQFLSLGLAYYFGERDLPPTQPVSGFIEVNFPPLTVNTVFDFDETEIKVVQPLDRMVARLLKYPDATAVITGYADNQGDAEYNRKLSVRRAKAVSDYLVTQGISESRLSYEGVGADQSIIDNATAENRVLNRRVQVFSPSFDVLVEVSSGDFVEVQNDASQLSDDQQTTDP